MELERRKGGRKDPWGIASATSLYPPERESKASWRPVRLSATICVLNFPLCSFQCAGKGVPLRPQTALPGKWPLSLWPVPSRTPAPPPPTPARARGSWVSLAPGQLAATSSPRLAFHKTLTHRQMGLPRSFGNPVSRALDRWPFSLDLSISKHREHLTSQGSH